MPLNWVSCLFFFFFFHISLSRFWPVEGFSRNPFGPGRLYRESFEGFDVGWEHLPLCDQVCSNCLRHDHCRRSVERLSDYSCSPMATASNNTTSNDLAIFDGFVRQQHIEWCWRSVAGDHWDRPVVLSQCTSLLKKREQCMFPRPAPVAPTIPLTQKDATRRITTRSPSLSSQNSIHRWRHELSSELESSPLTRLLPQISCQSALNELCLRHIACKELWKIFRHSCVVDGENQCRMTNRQDCWQSFEGISWTGLGNCSCSESKNSDCHWIRLLTNYNKCIYEIQSSGGVQNSRGGDGVGHRREQKSLSVATTPKAMYDEEWRSVSSTARTPEPPRTADLRENRAHVSYTSYTIVQGTPTPVTIHLVSSLETPPVVRVIGRAGSPSSTEPFPPSSSTAFPASTITATLEDKSYATATTPQPTVAFQNMTGGTTITSKNRAPSGRERTTLTTESHQPNSPALTTSAAPWMIISTTRIPLLVNNTSRVRQHRPPDHINMTPAPQHASRVDQLTLTPTVPAESSPLGSWANSTAGQQ